MVKPLSSGFRFARHLKWRPPQKIASTINCDHFALVEGCHGVPLYFSTKVERISGHGISGPPFWRFSSAKTERTRAQGFTAVFGLFLVPSKHMPSAAFQRAMLHGEAPVGCCGEIRLTKCQNGWLICAHTHTDTHTHIYIYYTHT